MSSPGPSSASVAPARPWRDAYELLASMRFAIALLTLICIASVIGTVVQQNEPYVNYVNQFGPYWAEVFAAVGLYTVYSAGWFLVILGFLVISTSLCIARNTPKILAELRTFKEQVREQSLAAFHHRAEAVLASTPDAMLQRSHALLAALGWQARAQVRTNGTMIAARKGMAHKIGYLAAHSAIVLVCLGGLLDGDLVVRAQMAWQGKSSYSGSGLVRDVPAQHRLSATNPTFRANLLVPEGGRAGVAILNMPDGVVLQDLPFDVELRKFSVEHYETGMPKLFASEIVIHDRDTGATRAATVKVNEPVTHRGITMYQSSFDDGGSLLRLRARPLAGGPGFDLQGTVGQTTELTGAQQSLRLEYTGLRVINVEEVGGAAAPDGVGTASASASEAAASAAGLGATIERHLGSAARPPGKRTTRNIGPSFTYKLRDASGQAREYQNYMLPVDMDGQRVFLAGVRDTPAEPFRYLRIPADANDSPDDWLRARAALLDPVLREKAAQRYASLATPADRPQMRDQIQATALRALALYAGAERVRPASAAASAPGADPLPGGLPALAEFIESQVPQDERTRMSEVLLRILSGSLFELANLAREQAGLGALPLGEGTQRFMQQAMMAWSDAAYYPAPVWLQLDDYTQIQASVFQVARAPGRNLVYLGAVLLIVGVFAMLYVRERRLWIWLQPEPGGHTRVRVALSTTRRTLDADAEFDQLQAALLEKTP